METLEISVAEPPAYLADTAFGSRLCRNFIMTNKDLRCTINCKQITKKLEEGWLFVWTVVTVTGSEIWVNTLTEGVLFV